MKKNKEKNMENYILISNEPQSLTACGDICEILRFKDIYKDSFPISLCVTHKIDCNRKDYEEVYFLYAEDDFCKYNFPYIITEEAAKEIMEDPHKGIYLVHQRYMDRNK